MSNNEQTTTKPGERLSPTVNGTHNQPEPIEIYITITVFNDLEYTARGEVGNTGTAILRTSLPAGMRVESLARLLKHDNHRRIERIRETLMRTLADLDDSIKEAQRDADNNASNDVAG